MKYLFIDFGISSQFEPGEDLRVPLIVGSDRSPPKFKQPADGSYDPRLIAGDLIDPFPLDVHYLGNLIRRNFLDVSVSRDHLFLQ